MSKHGYSIYCENGIESFVRVATIVDDTATTSNSQVLSAKVAQIAEELYAARTVTLIHTDTSYNPPMRIIAPKKGNGLIVDGEWHEAYWQSPESLAVR